MSWCPDFEFRGTCRLFSGLSPKSMEFATSYFVTGAMSVCVLAELGKVFADGKTES